MADNDNAQIYATAKADDMEAALASGSAEQVMAVYRQIRDDGHPDAADALIAKVLAAGVENLRSEDAATQSADADEWEA